MKEARSSPNVLLEKRPTSPLAGLLSYLVPGLGQIYQGRVGKGLLFLVCLYVLFFYGLYLGNWQNVYVYFQPPPAPQDRLVQPNRNPLYNLITDRARFFAQAWIGIAAWPAILQYMKYDPNAEQHPVLGKFERMPTEAEQNAMLRDNDKSPDLGWVYTVIAGVLNILVIYDAYAGPVFPGSRATERRKAEASEEARA